MDYQIEHGPVFTTLRFTLQKDEQIRAEAGAMVSMSPTIELEAKSAGKGLLGTFKAAVGGEALFASLYTAKEAGELILAPAAMGDIIKLDLNGNMLFAQSGAYLAGTPGLELSTQGSLKAMISGEGLFLQKISGTGMVFLNSYGQILEKQLQSGEKYIVDTGHIVAFESTVQWQIRKAAKTLLSSIGTAEGLACEYTGPGKIWIQTRNLSALARLLHPLLPK
jgi:uncharacterized protein (TIGR00266 family)